MWNWEGEAMGRSLKKWVWYIDVGSICGGWGFRRYGLNASIVRILDYCKGYGRKWIAIL